MTVRSLPEYIEESLPERLLDEIRELAELGRVRMAEVSEVRLRQDRPASLTVAGVNLPLGCRLTAEELNLCLTRLCRGSVYAHGESIREGYVQIGEGVRVGVCGRAAGDGNVSDITSLNLRVPHMIRGVCEALLKRCLRPDGTVASMLIYSPPGIGKTTLLRDLAATLGGEYKRRVAVIDTRGELYMPAMFADTLCDFLNGYPRAKGVELATRTLSPEVLVCDELGDLGEAQAILSAQNTGVPLIASAHAASLTELLARPNIRLLHDRRIFDSYVGISRESRAGRLSRCFGFQAAGREDADRL